MKKLLLPHLVVALLSCMSLCVPFNALAQEHNHNAEHQHDHEGGFFVGGATSLFVQPAKSITTFVFEPEAGYMFNNDFGVGIMLGYELRANNKLYKHEMKVSPFARYYYLHKAPFNFYFDGGFGYSLYKGYGNQDAVHGFEVGVRPGACIDLTEGLCLCLRMGFIGYRSHYHGAEDSLPESGYGFSFTPEELMIGLEIEF